MVDWRRYSTIQLGNRLGRDSLLGVPLVLARNNLCSVLDPQTEFRIETPATIDGCHWGRCFSYSSDANALRVNPDRSHTCNHCVFRCFAGPFCSKIYLQLKAATNRRITMRCTRSPACVCVFLLAGLSSGLGDRGRYPAGP